MREQKTLVSLTSSQVSTRAAQSSNEMSNMNDARPQCGPDSAGLKFCLLCMHKERTADQYSLQYRAMKKASM